MRRVQGPVAAAILWTWCGAVQAGYIITDLGVLPGGVSSTAYGINDAGAVVGSTSFSGGAGQRAFVYAGGVMNDLGTLPGDTTSVAIDINDAGQVVGVSSNGSVASAFLYTPGSGFTNLGALPGGATSRAEGINDAGQVVGGATTGSAQHAFLYSGGVMTDLGTLPGDVSSVANDINDAGQIVGASTGSSTHAFLYSPGTGMMDLGTLTGSGVSVANALNNSGDVVGYSSSASGPAHAFLYSGGVMTDLGTLAGGTAEPGMGHQRVRGYRRVLRRRRWFPGVPLHGGSDDRSERPAGPLVRLDSQRGSRDQQQWPDRRDRGVQRADPCVPADPRGDRCPGTVVSGADGTGDGRSCWAEAETETASPALRESADRHLRDRHLRDACQLAGRR